jgi:hypothetical protein
MSVVTVLGVQVRVRRLLTSHGQVEFTVNVYIRRKVNAETRLVMPVAESFEDVIDAESGEVIHVQAKRHVAPDFVFALPVVRTSTTALEISQAIQERIALANAKALGSMAVSRSLLYERFDGTARLFRLVEVCCVSMLFVNFRCHRQFLQV